MYSPPELFNPGNMPINYQLINTNLRFAYSIIFDETTFIFLNGI
jgi:hypothetical protein